MFTRTGHPPPARALHAGSGLALLDRNGGGDAQAWIDIMEQRAGEDPPRLCCRVCAHPVTTPSAAIHKAGSHQHHCTNPLGHRFGIGCFAHASGCRCAGPATRDHTWFAGYAWRIALCGGCGMHLGWRYEGGAGDFYGLILEQLIPCGDDRPH